MHEQSTRVALAIDDYSLFSASIRQTLGSRGFDVISAKSPQRGLALFQTHQAKVDLVAIDMTMPSASNLDLAADLERLRPGLPILYLVGPERSIARCCFEAQAPHSVLVTPFAEQQLIDRAGRLLRIEIAAQRRPETQLWDRLIAASGPVLAGTAILHVYGLRQSPLAADHIAILRAVAIDHSVRPTNCDEAPYSIVLHAKDVARARSLLAKAVVTRQLVTRQLVSRQLVSRQLDPAA